MSTRSRLSASPSESIVLDPSRYIPKHKDIFCNDICDELKSKVQCIGKKKYKLSQMCLNARLYFLQITLYTDGEEDSVCEKTAERESRYRNENCRVEGDLYTITIDTFSDANAR